MAMRALMTALGVAISDFRDYGCVPTFEGPQIGSERLRTSDSAATFRLSRLFDYRLSENLRAKCP